MTDQGIHRRAIIAGGIAAGAALFMPARLGSAVFTSQQPPGPEKRLAFRCVHTGHKCDAVFMRGTQYDRQGLAELDRGLCDWRTREKIEIDRDLLSLLVDLRDSMGVSLRTPFELISGYRSPGTNAALHGRSDGVATKSQHMLGKAVDIALPGISTDSIRQAARSLARGGVGHYPRDGFVHLDTGRIRFW